MFAFAGSKAQLPLFKEDTRRNKKFYFPPEGLGKIELRRLGLVKKAQCEVEDQRHNGAGVSTLYLHGTRASGKSIVLQQLAKSLQTEGYIVYFFPTGDALQQIGLQFKGNIVDSLPSDENAKIAVLVDEVHIGSAAGQLVTLLKSTRQNLVVIGVGGTPVRSFRFDHVLQGQDLCRTPLGIKR